MMLNNCFFYWFYCFSPFFVGGGSFIFVSLETLVADNCTKSQCLVMLTTLRYVLLRNGVPKPCLSEI